MLVPVPTYPLYTAVLAKIGARPVFYRTDPANGWLPDVRRDPQRLITPATRALVVIDPNNPTGATYPADVRRALLEIADEHNIPLLADEVYADLAFDGPVDAIAQLESRRAGHHVLVAVEGVPRARLALGMDGRRPDRAARRRARRRSRSWRTAGCAAPAPMEYAIVAALNGDRSHQQAFRAALRERADLTDARLNAIDGMSRRSRRRRRSTRCRRSRCRRA